MFRRARSQPDPPSDLSPDIQAQEDERWLIAASQGDLDAFNRFVERHERAVYNLCYRMLGDPDAADDAAQDTFLKAWAASRTFQGGRARPWLMRIATNRCFDVLRSQKRHPTSSLDAIQESTSNPVHVTRSENPDEFAVRSDLSGYLERALAQVPEEQRLALTLCDIQGMPQDEAAAVMGVATGTVKSRLSRGRAKLRDILRSDPVTRELLHQPGRFEDE